MLIMLLWLFSFLFFTFFSHLILNKLFKNRLIISRRVIPFLAKKTEKSESNQENVSKNKSFYNRFFRPMIGRFRRFAIGKLPKSKLEQLEIRLLAAGRPFNLSAGDYMLLQILLPAGLFILFLTTILPVAENRGQIFLFSIILSAFVYFYMNNYLKSKGKQRIKAIDKAMPDFFDMLNVSLEAGMGLDGALKKACIQIRTPLSSEFLSALEDMRLGKTRKEAFTELRDRVESESFKSVMNSIIQADQMGLGMSKVLRTQTQRIREKQRFRAKEQAMKAPVKMLIPMVLFIFPTLFIVLLGPVIVNAIAQFL